MQKYDKLAQEIEQLKSTVECLSKRVRVLECSHTKTHFEYTPDYYEFSRETNEVINYYREICDNCGKSMGGSYTEEEMLKIKIERDKKRLDYIEKTKVKIK